MFILVENIMNGTVTMNTIVTGFDVTTFGETVKMIRNMLKDKKVHIHEDTSNKFSYTIPQQFPVVGIIENKPLKIYQ